MLTSLPDSRQYSFKLDTDGNVVTFTRGAMQAFAMLGERGVIHVVYESSLHEKTEEQCTPEQAATLIDVIMARKSLFKVEMPLA